MPGVSLDNVMDGIWIGDSNLFRPPTSRRFLLGLAAYTEQPLRFVPSLLEPFEIPGQFANSCMVMRTNKVLDESKEIQDIYFRCHSKARESFYRWMEEWTAKGGIEVMSIDDSQTRSEMISVMGAYTTQNRLDSGVNHDQVILAECVVSDAQFIATNNLHTIKHEEVNQWALNQGRNHNQIGTLSDLAKLLIDDEEELAIVGAMVISDTPRELADEKQSLDYFIDTLYILRHNVLGERVSDCLKALSPIDLEQFVESSRQIASTPAFVQARKMNEELVDVRMRIQEQWYELIREINPN